MYDYWQDQPDWCDRKTEKGCKRYLIYIYIYIYIYIGRSVYRRHTIKFSSLVIVQISLKKKYISKRMWLCTQPCVFTCVFVHDETWLIKCIKFCQHSQKHIVAYLFITMRGSILFELLIVKDFFEKEKHNCWWLWWVDQSLS